MAIAIISSTAMDARQKTENYGYYETESVSTTESIEAKTVNVASSEVINPGVETAKENIVSSPEVVAVTEMKNIEKKDKVSIADHSVFDALLKAHVSNSGMVDYAAIKSKVSKLDEYLGYLSQNIPTSKASENESLAFWINAYNANTIKLIVDNYPVTSIMDLYGGKAFDNKWIKIGGETLSLNDIENNKIRAKYNEPRIHFAVNCAAKSCPPILNKAWTAGNVQANLEARTKAFINDSSFNTISSGAVRISKIFEWYAKDFPSNIVSYLNKYSKTTIDSGAKVGYNEYDWALNSK